MDRWQQVSQLYHAALERTAGERAGFLREACAGDARLRQEVELLLAQGETAERLLAVPALDVAATVMGNDEVPSLIGRQLGTYRLQSLLGTGGMGEVYRARDTGSAGTWQSRSCRSSSPHEADRLARFEREARVLAALNHPNIATIHGVEESDGVTRARHGAGRGRDAGRPHRAWTHST